MRLGFGAPLSILRATGTLMALATVLGVAAWSPDTKPQGTASLDKEFSAGVRPLLVKYCTPCHGSKNPTEGFDITKPKGVADILKAGPEWEKADFNLKTKSMPPNGAQQPSDGDRAKMVDWVERALATDCNLADPGRVTIRRLNRVEYNNTVRDLLGVNLSPADDFPSDDVGYGFDNIGDVLSTSPLHMEKYLAAAEKLANAAIVPRTPRAYHEDYSATPESKGSHTNDDGGREFFTNDNVPLIVKVGAGGDYRLRISAFGDQAGPEPPMMVVTVNGAVVDKVPVKAERPVPQTYEIPVELKGGETKVEIAFTNDYYEPTNPNPKRRDRNLIVESVELYGPTSFNGEMPATMSRILFEYPGKKSEESVAREVLARFAGRAFRRPAGQEELDRLMSVYHEVRKGGDGYERAIQVCVAATLCSPNFLYRVELDSTPKKGKAGYSLDGYELASRLSYFLWSSMPDADLEEKAKDGLLADPKVLDVEVERMLASPKAKALADNFAVQWLQLRKLEIASPDPSVLPNWGPAMKRSMQQEATMFFNDVLSNGLDLGTFLDSDFTYVNEDLAKVYGIPDVAGAEMRKVSVDRTRRGGLLGMAGILTITSNPYRTSPVKRGRWILEQILGTPPPPPPPNVGILPDDKEAIAAKTIKERMEAHRKNPMCAACHKPMDAMGFSMENFNAVGSWRTMDGTFPVDPTGELPDGTKIDGIGGLKRVLMSRKKEFVRSLAEKMLTYAAGRGLRPVDRCQVDLVTDNAVKDGDTLKSLIKAVIKSDVFRMRMPADAEQ